MMKDDSEAKNETRKELEIPKTIEEFARSTIEQPIKPTGPKKYYYRCPCGGALHVMNTADGENYTPTKFEESANVITHLLPAIVAVFMLIHLMKTEVNTPREAVSGLIYGGCCILLFSISSLYHLCGLVMGYECRLNKILQKMDHTVIYAFIASSYTPFLVLVDVVVIGFSCSKAFTVVIWAIAVFGLLKSYFDIIPSLASLFVYLFMGWISVIYLAIFGALLYFGVVTTSLNLWGVGLDLIIGGILYSVGACTFFRLDGSIPCAHAIWHVFTVFAAAFHFHAILKYVMVLE